MDGDVVDISNLQRQVLHSTQNLGRPKVDSGAEAIRALNPDVTVVAMPQWIQVDNIMDVLGDYDVVIDGSDNFDTRYLVNDACYLAGKVNVHGSIFQFEGMATVFAPDRGPCYRCLYPAPPPAGLVPSCGEAGVLGVLPGTIGLVQATETIKLLLGIGEPLIGRLLTYDALGMRFREVKLRRDPGCPLCGTNPTIKDLSMHHPGAPGCLVPTAEPAVAGARE
jgi:adenylyltransferase/sulfurtransferase